MTVNDAMKSVASPRFLVADSVPETGTVPAMLEVSP